MNRKHLVCQGALCRCSFGTTPDKLKVLTQSRHYINDKDSKTKLTASHADIGSTFEKNSFGSCSKMDNRPCRVVVTGWSGYYEKITLEDNQGRALLEDSKASCPVGGRDCITIVHHGQTVEVSRQNLKNARPEVISELCPFFDLEEDEALLQIKNLK